MKVSVIVPIYNAEEYLERCLDSILGQSFDNFELILINDKSSDGSAAICRRYQTTDNRIRYVENETNMGVAATRNRGIDLACGDYIMFCDNDDIVSIHWMAHLVSCVMAEETVLPVCSISDSLPDLGKAKALSLIHGDEDNFRYYLLNQAGIAGYIWNAIYQRRILNEHSIRFPSRRNIGDINEDLIFSLEYVKHVRKVRYTGYADYCHTTNCTNHGSVTDDRWYFEKYREKYHLWKDFILAFEYQQCHYDLLHLKQQTMYHFLHALACTRLQGYKKLMCFRKVVCSEEMQELVRDSTVTNESDKIKTLIRHKCYLLLYLLFQLKK